MFRLVFSALAGVLLTVATATACPPLGAASALGQICTPGAGLYPRQMSVGTYVAPPAATIVQREVQYVPPATAFIQREVQYVPPATALLSRDFAPSYSYGTGQRQTILRDTGTAYCPPSQQALLFRDPGVHYLPPNRLNGTTLYTPGGAAFSRQVQFDIAPGRVIHERDVVHHGGLYHPRRDEFRSRTTIR